MYAEDEATLLLDAADAPDDLERLLARRVAGEPLEHVLGWAGFRGLRVSVGPGVFVPRWRTAFLVDVALGLLAERPQPVVVDLCCGTGAIGTALLAEVPGVEVHAADLDPRAVASARLNLEPRGGRVHEGDLYDALPGDLRSRVDVLAVNAPYVPTDAIATMPPEARDHEARIALDGGGDGLDVHRRVAAGARDWLAPGRAPADRDRSRPGPGGLRPVPAPRAPRPDRALGGPRRHRRHRHHLNRHSLATPPATRPATRPPLTPAGLSTYLISGITVSGVNHDYLSRIGALIRDARKHRGWTQQQLADVLNTSQSAVNRIERGHQNLTFEMIARIGAALDNPIVQLGAGPTHLRVTGAHDALREHRREDLEERRRRPAVRRAPQPRADDAAAGGQDRGGPPAARGAREHRRAHPLAQRRQRPRDRAAGQPRPGRDRRGGRPSYPLDHHVPRTADAPRHQLRPAVRRRLRPRQAHRRTPPDRAPAVRARGGGHRRQLPRPGARRRLPAAPDRAHRAR